MTDTAVVYMVSYDYPTEAEVRTIDEEPQVINHSELDTTPVAICMERQEVTDIGLESEIIEPDSVLWRDEFADMDLGEELEL